MFSCCLPEKKPKQPAVPMVLEEEIKESGTSNKDIKDFYDIGKTLGVGSFGNKKINFLFMY